MRLVRRRSAVRDKDKKDGVAQGIGKREIREAEGQLFGSGAESDGQVLERLARRSHLTGLDLLSRQSEKLACPAHALPNVPVALRREATAAMGMRRGYVASARR